MTTQTARATYSYTRTFSPAMVNWLKNSLIQRGLIPADLSVASGSAELQQAWLNVRNRSVNDIQHEIRVMWYRAVEMENGIELSEAVEQVEARIAEWENGIWVDVAEDDTCNAPTVAPEAQALKFTTPVGLSKDEVTAARKICKMIEKNPTTKQILFYILQEYPTHETGFCNTAGIHTATMKSTVHNICKAANCPKHRTITQHLKRILMIETTSQGGWAKTR